MAASTLLFIVSIILSLLGILLPQQKKQRRIRLWRKTFKLQEHAKIFNQLYQSINGFSLSQRARQKSDALDYVYGEIEFVSFIALLSLIRPDEQTIFYDLGCGTGKAVLACAVVYPVSKSIGIEILPELYQTACNQKEQLAMLQAYTEKAEKINFIQGDFLTVNLQEATFIFINSTTLFSPTWDKLCARLDHLSQLITVITTSKPLLSKNFSIVMHTQVEMSWGIVSAFIHAKKE